MDMLTTVNEALVLTGNAPVTLNDGSDEWIFIATAWNAVINDLISVHNWPFAKYQTDLVLGAGDESDKYDYGHNLPDAVVSLRSVFVDGYLTTEYELIGRTVYLDANSGVSIEYIAMPEDEDWHPQTTRVLRTMLMAACYRGLNEDISAADNMDRNVEFFLSQARAIVSAQNPGRRLHRGAATEARQVRRG